jgi:hypothetical protein
MSLNLELRTTKGLKTLSETTKIHQLANRAVIRITIRPIEIVYTTFGVNKFIFMTIGFVTRPKYRVSLIIGLFGSPARF